MSTIAQPSVDIRSESRCAVDSGWASEPRGGASPMAAHAIDSTSSMTLLQGSPVSRREVKRRIEYRLSQIDRLMLQEQLTREAVQELDEEKRSLLAVLSRVAHSFPG